MDDTKSSFFSVPFDLQVKNHQSFLSALFGLFLKRLFNSILRNIALLLIGVYRTLGTSQLGGCCRFEPSCSEFALGCYNRFSFLKATRLVLYRLWSCRPGGAYGFDPIPDQKGKV